MQKRKTCIIEDTYQVRVARVRHPRIVRPATEHGGAPVERRDEPVDGIPYRREQHLRRPLQWVPREGVETVDPQPEQLEAAPDRAAAGLAEVVERDGVGELVEARGAGVELRDG